jgi:hypothetical protein
MIESSPDMDGLFLNQGDVERSAVQTPIAARLC